MGFVKTSITPENIFTQAKKRSNNFSLFVTKALSEYIRKQSIQRAIESFGTWQKREENSIDIVNKIRSDEGRDYASGNN
ncbi:MAG: hypothetical protein AB1630_03405 [bacterium]